MGMLVSTSDPLKSSKTNCNTKWDTDECLENKIIQLSEENIREQLHEPKPGKAALDKASRTMIRKRKIDISFFKNI
jgi:hypothetical protein